MLLVAVGFLGGLLGGMSGLGGASIITPILTAAGVPVRTAIANSAITIVATSSGSSSAFLRDRYTNVKVALYLELFALSGGTAGACLSTRLPPRALYLFFAAFLIASLLVGGRQAARTPPPAQLRGLLGLRGEYCNDHGCVQYEARRPHLAGPLMVVAGAAAGALGIGAGAFKTAILERVMGLPAKVSSATSIYIVGMTGLASSAVYVRTGLVDPFIAGPLVLGATIGSMLGSRLLARMSDRAARAVSMSLTLYVAAQMLAKGVVSG